MTDFGARQRNLLFGLASTFVLAALGATVFHVRWGNGAEPTELMGWMLLTSLSMGVLTLLTLESCDVSAVNTRVRVYLSVASGGSIMLLVPLPLAEVLFRAFPQIGDNTVFTLLFSLILGLSFVLAVCVYSVVEDEN